MKYCKRCNILKDINLFNKNKLRADGMSFYCKLCEIEINKEYKHNKWVNNRKLNNKIIVNYKECLECLLLKPSIEYRKIKNSSDGLYNICLVCANKLNNLFTKGSQKDRYIVRNKRLLRNKNNINKKARESYFRCKNVFTRLKKSISKSIRVSLKKKNTHKTSSTFKYLPYTMTELRDHLESKFEPWMTWENWGVYDVKNKTWQIDHIIPQSKLLYSSFQDENFMKCWELNNLQPLETIKNIIKGDRC